MKILKFNESVRDQMTGVSKDVVKSAILKLTPYGMIDKIYHLEEEDNLDGEILDEFEKIANERIDASFKELDKIFERYEDKDLYVLVTIVCNWVAKNGGNEFNISEYGFKSLAEQIVNNGIQDRHDSIVIYDKEVFDSFRKLLKDFAACEIQHNNKDYDN